MAKAVFTTKINPTYDDLPEVRYHFPQTYLNQVRESIRDWILYYEPRRSSGDSSSRGGRQSYFAVARVDNVESDPNTRDHYYAKISDYLEFDHPVPFKSSFQYYESALQRPDGNTNKGAFGRSVRPISDIEFNLILSNGFDVETNERGRLPSALEQGVLLTGMSEAGGEYLQETTERRIVESISLRPFREEAFRRQVRNAYGNTCSMSGLRLINGGGRPEVQAAHIRPVSALGPDSARNGIALSGTLHWMFDRGLLSVDDNYKILASKKVPEEARRLLRPDMQLILPNNQAFRPHVRFLRFHRETVFKE
jgi:putative restriction endonuclease